MEHPANDRIFPQWKIIIKGMVVYSVWECPWLIGRSFSLLFWSSRSSSSVHSVLTTTRRCQCHASAPQDPHLRCHQSVSNDNERAISVFFQYVEISCNALHLAYFAEALYSLMGRYIRQNRWFYIFAHLLFNIRSKSVWALLACA